MRSTRGAWLPDGPGQRGRLPGDVGLQGGISNHNSYPTARNWRFFFPGRRERWNGTFFASMEGDAGRRKISISWGGSSGERTTWVFSHFLSLEQSGKIETSKAYPYLHLLGYRIVITLHLQSLRVRVDNSDLPYTYKEIDPHASSHHETSDATRQLPPVRETIEQRRQQKKTSRNETHTYRRERETPRPDPLRTSSTDAKKPDTHHTPFSPHWSWAGTVLGSRLGLYAAGPN